MFIAATNATRYFFSFPDDTPVGTTLFKFTAYVDESVFTGGLFGIFVTISQSGTIQSLFSFDSGTREKNYQGSTLNDLDRIGAVIAIPESIFLLRVVLADDPVEFDFNLNIVPFGIDNSGTEITQDLDVTVSVTITRPPSEL